MRNVFVRLRRSNLPKGFGGGKPARARSLAFYLACYLAAALLPMFAVVVLITSQYVSAQRTQLESYAKSALGDIRDEFDRDMASKIAMLQALATSPALIAGDFAQFHAQALRALAPDDVAIILRDPNQQQLVHTRLGWGASLPPSRDGAAAAEVFETKRPYISNLYIAEFSGKQRVSVTVPVMQGDNVIYSLSVSFDPSHYTELFRRQPLLESYYASVTDRMGRILSRSEQAESFVGRPLPGFAKAQGADGRWSGVNPQGVSVVGFYRRSALSGWLFSIGVDQAVISRPLHESLIRLSLLCGALLFLGSILTFGVGRHLTGAFARLTTLAGSGQGPVAAIATPVAEANFIGKALAAALTRLHGQAEQLELAKTRLESNVEERTRQLSVSAAQLAVSNANFEAAISNMSQGLCMLDVQQRVIVSNARFLEIYGLSPEQVRPGTSLTEILTFRKAAGTYSGLEPAEEAKGMLQTREELQQLHNGRFVRILRNPIAGGNFLTTHEDVTDLKRAEQELDETKKFLDTIVENMPVAIVAKDAATGKFVLVNKAYVDYLGVPRDRIIGGTVHDLYAPEVAEKLDAFDRAATAPGTEAIMDNFEVEALGKATRHVTTTRVAVRNSKGKATLILVMIEDVTQRKRSEQRIAYLAHHDTLTDLANRAAFVEHIDAMLCRLRDTGKQFSIFLIDLDRFKDVNDTLGHLAGDELLMGVARRLGLLLGPGDVAARIGGDEFAIIKANGSADDAGRAAAQIIDNLKAPFDIGNALMNVGASIGIALAPEHGTCARDLMTRADLALYRAKSLGRQQYAFYEDSFGEQARTKQLTQIELEQAVAAREFVVHYQPVVDLKSRKPIAVEALVRWQHPSKGLLAPGSFMPIAEETGLIISIGEQVLGEACSQATAWPEDIKLCVNVSVKQLSGNGLVTAVRDVLKRSGLAASRLELEITETAMIDQGVGHLDTMQKLKALGVSISLDDFGTGYSSLSQLTTFPFDRIKIDKSFTQNIAVRADASAIILALQSLAHALKIPTIAEGVETEEQLRLLHLAGVPFVQGFLFGRPVPAHDLVIEGSPAPETQKA